MSHRIEVALKDRNNEHGGLLGLKRPIKVYQINDVLTPEQLAQTTKILTDPVAEEYTVDSPIIKAFGINNTIIEKSPRPGVTDPHGEEVRGILSRKFGREIGPVSFGEQYIWRQDLDDNALRLVGKQLGNPIINTFRRASHQQWEDKPGFRFDFPTVPTSNPSAFEYVDVEVQDEQLRAISDRRFLALSLDAMKAIQNQFRDPEFIAERRKVGLEAKPTDAELEGTGSSWSDHCNHNKFKAKWNYTTEDKNDESNLPPVIDNMFKQLIMSPSRRIMSKLGTGVSLFEDNAGVVKLNDRWNIAHKVETHNYPSGEDGFGGANTGIGGVLRDIVHTGTGMRVTSNEFSFRTAHPNSYKDLPIDIQTPSRTLETIILGVEDYGNKSGIPTVIGTTIIGDGWFKPGVYVGSKGVREKEINGKLTHLKDVKPGYIAIALGGRIGKDGIHGATGSSMDLDASKDKSAQIAQSVQIGNPITQKEYFDVAMILQNEGLVEASQDCGAGGYHSAAGELAALCNSFEEDRYAIITKFSEKGITKDSPLEDKLRIASSVVDLNLVASPSAEQIKSEVVSGEIFNRDTNGKAGMVLDLTNTKVKYPGLMGWEKLVSESQERGVIAIKPENLDNVLKICRHYNVETNVLGKFDNTGFYHVRDQDQAIAFLPIKFLQRGIPQMVINAHWKRPKFDEPVIAEKDDLTNEALELLGRPNTQRYNWINERFDHEVQSGSLIKSIVGKGRGKSEAVAGNPVATEKEVVIETWGSNPLQGDIDPYHMGVNNVVDAIGRVIAIGGKLERITFNGNTTCPPPEKDTLDAAKVLRMIKGAADAEEAFDSPTISGKDSTSMQRGYKSTLTGNPVSIKAKPELLKSAMAILPDDSTLVTPDFKIPGDKIFVIGETRDELGASEYYGHHKAIGNNIPKSNLDEIKARYTAIPRATQEGLLHSAQYLSRLGLFYGLSNSAIAGDLGVNVDVSRLVNDRADKALFSESTGRLVVSVHPTKVGRFREVMAGNYIQEIGEVTTDKSFKVKYQGRNVISTDVGTMRERNEGGIKF